MTDAISTIRRTALATAAVLALLSGCAVADDGADAPTDPTGDDTTGTEQAEGDATGGNAVLTLDDGTEYRDTVECTLEPHTTFAGTENERNLEWSALSTYDGEFAIEVRRFAPDSNDGTGEVVVTDVEQRSIVQLATTAGSLASLELDGTSITGSGDFGPIGGAKVAGTLEVAC